VAGDVRLETVFIVRNDNSPYIRLAVDVIFKVIVKVVVVGIIRADAESFLVADGVSVVESDATGPVVATAARLHGSIDGVLQTSTGIREPI
jgi:hypothetical protein